MKKINQWLALGANLVVIVGLIFLTLQIKQNTTQLRANASFTINESISMMNSSEYNNPILSDILNRGEENLTSLNPTELRQFIAYQWDRINLAIHMLILEEEGLSDLHFPYVTFLIQQYHNKPGLQEFIVSVEHTWVGDKKLYFRLRK